VTSAEEFVSLRASERREDYLRAAHCSASNEVWLDVIKRFPEMRFWVAQNKTVAMEILFCLASDPDANVRTMVAMKHKLSKELMTLLANDVNSSVRQQIASNKKTPDEILRRLALDSSEIVAREARERLKKQNTPSREPG
jgi:hypothetical protein